MPKYIKEYTESYREKDGVWVRQFFQEFYEELRCFDPSDCEPSVQALLVKSRYSIRFAADSPKGMHTGQMTNVLDGVIRVFEHFKGEGSVGIQRSFAYISDGALRTIIERDYAE